MIANKIFGIRSANDRNKRHRYKLSANDLVNLDRRIVSGY